MGGFRSALPVPLGVGKPGVALGFVTLPWFRGGTLTASPPISPSVQGGGPGFALSFRQERDWDKVRKARDEIRTALEEATTGPRKQRKEAARKAALAIEDVLAVIRTRGSSGAWADVLLDLEGLMASLGAMMEAERIRVEEARRAADEWARIEAEFRMQQFLEEELLVVLALV